MARPLRLQFPDAVYHVTARGNAQADIVVDDVHRDHWRDALRSVTIRHGWEVLSYALMDNHFHLFVRTPEPNLARGMQRFLSAYANWFARRLGRRGHVFQGRYDARLVEGDAYFWNVSRYVHLNPVRAGMVATARDWAWSSFPGFVDPARAEPWVAYDSVLRAWHGDFGGSPQDARTSYAQFVDSAEASSLVSPFETAFDGWILGSDEFVDRVRRLAKETRDPADPDVPADTRLRCLTVDRVLRAVTARWRINADDLRDRRNTEARFAFADLAIRRTDATRAEVARVLGLARGQSVAHLLWRRGGKRAGAALLGDAIAVIADELDSPGYPGSERCILRGSKHASL